MQSGPNKSWPLRLRRSGHYITLCCPKCLQQNAKICNKMPKIAKKNAANDQNLPKDAKKSQRLPIVAKSSQKLSKAVKSSLKLPKVA